MKVNIGPFVDEGDRVIDVHIDEFDTWSMDDTLSHIILPMLKQLKETKNGAPNVDKEDVPPELRPTIGEELRFKEKGETDENYFKRWDYVMDQMIFSFENKLNETADEAFFNYDDNEMATAFHEIQWKGVGPAQLLLFPDEDGKMEEYNSYEWLPANEPSKFDKQGFLEYNNKIDNGFRLFGKYFQNLWD